jgi:hypothetical protein
LVQVVGAAGEQEEQPGSQAAGALLAEEVATKVYPRGLARAVHQLVEEHVLQ